MSAARARWLAAAAAASAWAAPARAQAVMPPGPAPAAWALATGASRDAAGDGWVPQLSSAGRVRWVRRGRLAVETAGEGMVLLPSGGAASARALGAVRLTASAGRMGGWAGVGGGGVSAADGTLPILFAEAGGSWRSRRTALTLSVRQTRVSGLPGTFRDSVVTGPDTIDFRTVRVAVTPGLPGRRYTEAEVGLSVVRGAMRLAALAGARLEERDRRTSGWAQAGADLQLGSRASLSVNAGRLRGVPELDVRASPFLSLALRLTSGRAPGESLAPAGLEPPNAFGVRSDGAQRTLRVRVPGAARVELKGDFTDWQPRALSPGLDAGCWEITLPIAPGTYRVNLRVDGGAWGAPPGLLDVEDEFGGRVGLLVIG